MKKLIIDQKWSVVYDEDNNDKPVGIRRYDHERPVFDWENSTVAMFYALLETRQELEALKKETGVI